VQDCIDEATDTINQYAMEWYEESRLVNSLWVRRRATVIACWLLSQRRGNPGQFEERVSQITLELEKVLKGDLRIPRLPMRADFTPGVSNYRVDDRYLVRKTRVEPQISTGGRGSKQDIDRRHLPDEFIYP